jgi:hypothetical protein
MTLILWKLNKYTQSFLVVLLGDFSAPGRDSASCFPKLTHVTVQKLEVILSTHNIDIFDKDCILLACNSWLLLVSILIYFKVYLYSFVRILYVVLSIIRYLSRIKDGNKFI